MKNYLILLFVLFMCALPVKSQEVVKLDREQAGRLAQLDYKCIHTGYANNISHSMATGQRCGYTIPTAYSLLWLLRLAFLSAWT